MIGVKHTSKDSSVILQLKHNAFALESAIGAINNVSDNESFTT